MTHISTASCVYYHSNSRPGCNFNKGCYGKYCDFKEVREDLHGTVSQKKGFTNQSFEIVCNFLSVYYTRAKQKRRSAGVQHVTVAVPPDIIACDCDSVYDNILFMY